jgi:hypothetical protein
MGLSQECSPTSSHGLCLPSSRANLFGEIIFFDGQCFYLVNGFAPFLGEAKKSLDTAKFWPKACIQEMQDMVAAAVRVP